MKSIVNGLCVAAFSLVALASNAHADVQLCEKKVKELAMAISRFGSRLPVKPVDFEITESFTATRSHPIYGEVLFYDLVGLGQDTLNIKGCHYVIQLDGTCSLISAESHDELPR